MTKALKIVLTVNEVQRNEEFYFDSSFLRILTVGNHFVPPGIYRVLTGECSPIFSFYFYNKTFSKT
jgi:hypothetical protein